MAGELKSWAKSRENSGFRYFGKMAGELKSWTKLFLMGSIIHNDKEITAHRKLQNLVEWKGQLHEKVKLGWRR